MNVEVEGEATSVEFTLPNSITDSTVVEVELISATVKLADVIFLRPDDFNWRFNITLTR